MAKAVSFAGEPRNQTGKGPNRELRRQSRVPAIVYGGQGEPYMLSLPIKELKRELTSNPRFFSTVCTVDVDGQTMRVLPREAQLHPVTDDPIHIDFLRAAAGARINVEVPVVFINDTASPGIKRGGVLNIVRREIELSCPVDSIPAEIVVDLTGRDIHDSIHIHHISLPEGVTPTITDRDFTVCTIVPPTVAVADDVETPAAAEAPAAKAS